MQKCVNGVIYDLSLQTHMGIVYGMDMNNPREILEILEEIDGCFISDIDAQAFEENSVLKQIIIPDSITLIGEFAFYKCSSLQSVQILGNSRTYISIETKAFAFCENLERIESEKALHFLPKATSIFRNCPKLKELPFLWNEIPPKLTMNSPLITELKVVESCAVTSLLTFQKSGVKRIYVPCFRHNENARNRKAPLKEKELAEELKKYEIAVCTTDDSPAVNLAFDGVNVIIVDKHLN